MGESCETRPPFVQINRFPHRARRGVLGSASPFLTRDLRFPRRGIVRNSSTSWLNHRCLGGAGRAGPSAFLATHNSRTFQRGAGALGFASPSLTKGWDLPPRARGPSCETRPRLGKNLSLARERGADSSAFLRFAYFADYPAGRARRGVLRRQNRARQFPD